jgi:hypothetical protein
MAALIGAAVLVVGLNADAQQPAPSAAAVTATPASASDADSHERGHMAFSPEDRAAFFSARIAALHAGLTLTPDQEKLWPPVESAMRDMVKARMEQRQKMRSEPWPTDPIQRLERISERAIARGEGLKKLAAAAAPLYAALSDAQKHRLPVLLHAIHRRAMGERFATMRDEGEHEHMGWRHHDEDDDDHGGREERRGFEQDEHGGWWDQR